MRRILVIQLCRMGDVIQTTPMLRGLRVHQPDTHITLLIHEQFRETPIPSDLFDRLVAFPVTEMAGALARDPGAWPAQVRRLKEMVQDLAPVPFDLTLNLTHSDLSGLLTALIPARSVEGGLVAPDRTRIVCGPWMTYFWSSQTRRAQGCFNLVDLHNWTAGVPSVAGRPEIAVDDAATRAIEGRVRGDGDRRPLIAVQLGASDDRKRWPPERFGAALARLPEDRGSLVFVGAAAERPLVERALGRLGRPALDLVGETSLAELAALLARCRLLVTNDTGTMHVAAAVGTEVLDVSTGPVFVHETGPYGDGHLVVEPRVDCYPCAAGSTCAHVSCRDWIDPSDVAGLMLFALEGRPLPTPVSARILQASRSPDGIVYRTLWPPAEEPAERLRRLVAGVWKATLPQPGGSRPARPPRPAETGRFPVSNEAEGLLRAAGLADAIASLGRRMVRAGSTELPALGRDLTSLTEKLQLLAQLTPQAWPFTAYFKVRLDSTATRDVAALAAACEKEAALMAQRCRMLARALDEARPEREGPASRGETPDDPRGHGQPPSPLAARVGRFATGWQ